MFVIITLAWSIHPEEMWVKDRHAATQRALHCSSYQSWPTIHQPLPLPSSKKPPRPSKIRSKSHQSNKSNKNVHNESSFLLTSCFCLLANSERVKSTNTKSKETTALQCFFFGGGASRQRKCPVVWDNKDQLTTTSFLLFDTAQLWNRDTFRKKKHFGKFLCILTTFQGS